MGMLGLFGLSVAVLLLLLAARAPVALALGAAGLAGLWVDRGGDLVASVAGSIPYQSTARVALVVIPMFVLMGVLAERARIAEEILRLANRVLYRLPGGLGMATIAACAMFGAVSGSSIATAATMGRPSIREMLRHGYSKELASGIVAVAGTLSVMIPPSIVLVLYGIVTGESVGQLLLAGIIPGILSAVLLMLGVGILARYGPRKIRVDQSVAAQERAAATVGTEVGTGADEASTGGVGAPVRRGFFVRASELSALAKVMVLLVVVLGGIYGGVLTPSEAAGVGAFVALLILCLDLWGDGIRTVSRRAFDAFTETAVTTSFIFAILIGAGIYTYFLVSIGVPSAFANWAADLNAPGWVIVVALLLIMIPLGMFLDPLSTLIIVVPLAYPVIDALGYDGIWFGILVVKFIEIGLVTPPVGLNVFVVANTPGIRVESVYRGAMWLLPIDLVTVAILFAFPDLVTWLPSMLQ